METLSRHLQSWRAARGLSQMELAERAGIPRPNLIDLELGRRDCTVRTLTALAKALNITPGRLLDEMPGGSRPGLDRYERDELARSLITGDPPTSPKIRRLATDLRPLFRPALEAAGKIFPRKRSFVRRRKYRADTLYSKEFVKDVTERVHRLLPSFLEAEESRSPQ